LPESAERRIGVSRWQSQPNGGALGMEQSVLVPDKLSFHSPLPVDEVRRRLNDRTMNAYLGSWVEAAGGGPELLGNVRGRQVHLERPHVTNHAVPALEGTLGFAEEGGTILTAEISTRSAGHVLILPTSKTSTTSSRHLLALRNSPRPKTSSPTGAERCGLCAP
jgi:hypothetical protein